MKGGSKDPLMNPGQEPTGAIVPWACPECSGTLWKTVSDPVAQFRCRVGHAYSEESFLNEQCATIERTLWAAIRLWKSAQLLNDTLLSTLPRIRK